MAIYKPDIIKDKCTSLWHGPNLGKIELQNPYKDGNWRIPEDKYALLLDEKDCAKCIEHNSIDHVALAERDKLRRDAWNNNKAAY